MPTDADATPNSTTDDAQAPASGSPRAPLPPRRRTEPAASAVSPPVERRRFRRRDAGAHPAPFAPAERPAPPSAGGSRVIAASPPVRVQAIAARDRAFALALVAADVLAFGIAIGLAATAGAAPTGAALLLVAAVVAFAGGAGLYDRDELLLRKTSLEEAPRLVAVAGLVVLIGTLGEPLLFADGLGPLAGIVLWSSLTFALLAMRTGARTAVQTRVPPERCLVIGTAEDQERLERALGGTGSPSQLAARVPVERIIGETSDGRCEVNVRALAALVRIVDAQRIIISSEHATPGVTLDLLRASKAVGVRLSFLSVVLGAIGHGLVVDDVYGIPLVGVRRFRLRRRQRALKRSFDLTVGILLVIALLPVLVVLAVMIRLDSRGPIIFRQRRVGRHGRVFRIAKFRTMVADAEARKADLRTENEVDGGLFKIEHDPRITRVGRLLRKTSLDELPQLLNVLTGEMSLVGPRPLVLDEDEQICGYDRRRLDLTPGMTGHWQILGSARVPLEEMLRIDYRYVTGWTLWEDIKILLRTVPYVVARRGQ